ncbi:MAG: hypothetical protein Q9185_000963 [Variospora sp. 1 TL-2023]
MAPLRKTVTRGAHRAFGLYSLQAQQTDGRPYRMEGYGLGTSRPQQQRPPQQHEEDEEQEARFGIDERPNYGPSKKNSYQSFSATFSRGHFYNRRLPDGQEPLLGTDMLRQSTETALEPFTALEAQRDEYKRNIDRHLDDVVEAEDRARVAEGRLVNLRDEIHYLTTALNQVVAERDRSILQARRLRDTSKFKVPCLTAIICWDELRDMGFAHAERLQVSEDQSRRHAQVFQEQHPRSTAIARENQHLTRQIEEQTMATRTEQEESAQLRRIIQMRDQKIAELNARLHLHTSPPPPSSPAPLPQPQQQLRQRRVRSRRRSGTFNMMYDATPPPALPSHVLAPQRRRQQPVRVCKNKVRSYS